MTCMLSIVHCSLFICIFFQVREDVRECLLWYNTNIGTCRMDPYYLPIACDDIVWETAGRIKNCDGQSEDLYVCHCLSNPCLVHLHQRTRLNNRCHCPLHRSDLDVLSCRIMP